MTMEQLLRPRFKVTADYPENKDFPVDKIIDFMPWNTYYWQHVVEDCQGQRSWLSDFFDKYPHLFKPLEWWQEREEKDMPEYVKGEHGDVGKLGLRYSQRLRDCVEVEYQNGNITVSHLSNWLPATKEEYDAYQLNNKI